MSSRKSSSKTSKLLIFKIASRPWSLLLKNNLIKALIHKLQLNCSKIKLKTFPNSIRNFYKTEIEPKVYKPKSAKDNPTTNQPKRSLKLTRKCSKKTISNKTIQSHLKNSAKYNQSKISNHNSQTKKSRPSKTSKANLNKKISKHHCRRYKFMTRKWRLEERRRVKRIGLGLCCWRLWRRLRARIMWHSKEVRRRKTLLVTRCLKLSGHYQRKQDNHQTKEFL